MKIEAIADFACGCAERPIWNPQTKTLYFTDVDAPRLYSYDQASGDSQRIYQGSEVVGGLTLHEDGRLLLFMAGGAIRLWSPEGKLETLLEGIDGEEESRFNDVLADPEGRVFCGTMPVEDRQGKLYRWDPDGSIRVVLEEAGMPNGMGFSPDLRWFYFTNTNERTIERFAYDQKTGELSGREAFIEVPEGEGNPDGLVVDDEGCLWSARYGGWCLVRYSPEGKELSRIEFPMAENLTCPTFAGQGSSTMYVTTAGGPYRPQAGEKAGAVLRLEVEARGKAEYRSRYSA